MRNILFALLMVVLSAAAQQRDVSGTTVRYRTGSALTFDTTSNIKDEDSAWTISNTQLKQLSAISSNAANVTVTAPLTGITNALSAWPTAPLTPGGYAIVNSNATVYILTSTPAGSTWAATNKIAGP